MLRSLIRILHVSLVQIDTEMAKKYSNQLYVVGSYWKICHRMCVSNDWLGDLLTLKKCTWHLRWGTFIPNLGTLGLWVLELFAVYATN